MSKSHGLFNVVSGGLHPRRSIFDLSYSKSFDANFGLLYPIMCDEVIPGDTFKIGNKIIVRMANPLLAPILDDWDVYTHYFFVPYRLLDSNFEEFITGGINGDSTVKLFRLNLKDWFSVSNPPSKAINAVGSLGDLLGFNPKMPVKSDDLYVSYFPFSAYYSIWNEYYRDETLQPPVCLLTGPTPFAKLHWQSVPLFSKFKEEEIKSWNDVPGFVNGLARRNWRKDYFTSALPFQQRGQSPTLPVNISGYGKVEYLQEDSTQGPLPNVDLKLSVSSASGSNRVVIGNSATNPPKDTLTGNVFANMSTVEATSFNIADLRLAWQIQKWMERNARSGVRYTEFLGAHFGVSPKDERMMRPEYLGGSKQSIVISEVLQTSATGSGTPQGNMAGHGLSVASNFCCDYTASEFGLIMGLLSIMPKANYHQGINRQWLRETRYDYPFPEFVGLSEQEIKEAEIYPGDGSNGIFGYQGRLDELRYKPNMVCGQLRPGNNNYYDYWTLTRHFNSKPTLSSEFIACKPDLSGVFSVADENPFVVEVGNIIKAIRPIPSLAEPGYVDHF